MGRRQMHGTILSMLGIITLLTMLLSTVTSAPPYIKNPFEIIVAAIEGASPETVDPACIYDTASSELIFNVYETLLTFNGECLDKFIPQLSTEWVLENITGTLSPEELPWHYRYYFKIRTGVQFHSGYLLAPEDVEYSFERAMVQDRVGGPQWMFYEPLLDSSEATEMGDLNDPEDIIKIGKMIDHAVESNETHVWFNLAFAGAYSPLLHILCQPWSCILSRQWVSEYVIGVLGRPEWDGDWGTYTGWVEYYQPAVSPLDSPAPVMDGTGPFKLEILDFENRYWSAVRNPSYWRGWPADWPAPPYPPSTASGVKPAGFVTKMTVVWNYDWPQRSELFLNGEVDFCFVPRQHYSAVLGRDGVRCIDALPTLSVTGLFFAFDINLSASCGLILPAGTLNESGIPSDFFGNPDWGVHVRKGFAFAFDYDTYINQTALGEGLHPPTAILPGLPSYDSTLKGHVYNLTRAAETLQQVPGLWDTGFTLTFAYPISSHPQYLAELLKSGIENLNPKFHVQLTGISFSDYVSAIFNRHLPLFVLGWLADYPHAHDFAYPFYHSKGTYASWQAYSNPEMDALVDAGMMEIDPTVRRTIYHAVQVLAIEDCPSVMVFQPLSRHFERDWVVGWYYNPSSPGIYGYNLWKWYYVPHALQDVAVQPLSNSMPADINYDGQVNILDITVVAKAFVSSFEPPMHQRWQFRADIDNDRKVNIVDIAGVAKYFRRVSAVWIPPD